MQIGRKIYYDLATGNAILDTGERSGGVVETTMDQDFQTYVALAQRVPSTVGVLSIPYGQDSNKFGVYAYHIDITNPLNPLIVWDLTPIQQAAVVQQATIDQVQSDQDIIYAQILKLQGVAVNV